MITKFKTQKGSVLLNAIILIAVIGIFSSIILKQSQDSEILSRLPRIKNRMAILETRVRVLALTSTSYQNCDKGISSCQVRPGSFDQLVEPVLGAKCPSSSSKCGIAVRNSTFKAATMTLHSEIYYEGTEVSLKPIIVDQVVPPDVVMASNFVCPSNTPLFNGYSSTGTPICKSLPSQCNPTTGLNITDGGVYISTINAANLTFDCKKLGDVANTTCPPNQMISHLVWSPDIGLKAECIPRLNPFTLFTFNPVVTDIGPALSGTTNYAETPSSSWTVTSLKMTTTLPPGSTTTTLAPTAGCWAKTMIMDEGCSGIGTLPACPTEGSACPNQSDPIFQCECKLEPTGFYVNKEFTCSSCGGATTTTTVRSGGGRGGCFVAGTPILMADGSQKPIEMIKEGDRVFGFNEEKLAPVAQTVSKLHPHSAQIQILHEFVMEDGQSMTANNIHPIFVVEDGNYFHADQIFEMWKTGARISFLRADGAVIRVKEVRVTEKTVPVYNFEVFGIKNYNSERGVFGTGHNYFANGFLVHNAVYGSSLGKILLQSIIGVPSYALKCGTCCKADGGTPDPVTGACTY